MTHTRVAVLRGGPSEEYDVSMRTGMGVIRALNELGYQVKDVVITRKGEWLDAGIVRRPEHILSTIDVVFIALHGTYGEDGALQQFLDRFRIPYTGSAGLASKLAFNKIMAKERLKAAGIKQPQHRKVTREDLVRISLVVEELNSQLGQDLFVKPITSGSSLGAAYTPTAAKLQSTLESLLKRHESVMVEEFIRGKEATVAVLEGFRQQLHYVLPVIEIVPPLDDPIFSYENKYNGRTSEVCPGRFSYHEKAQLEDLARTIHQALNCRHYSRSDFMIRNGDIYFLELNTLPGLTIESLLPKAAHTVGLSYNDLVNHIVQSALKNYS